MKIYNVEEHLNCICYDNGDKPFVEVRRIERNGKRKVMLSANEIVFIMKGRLECTLRNSPDKELQKGQFIFLSAGQQIQYNALTDSLLLILRLTASIHLCHMYSIEKLYSEMNGVEKPESLFALDINARLQRFAEGLTETWEDGLKCRYYFLAEITKALTMIRVYYSKEDLCRFFFPVLSPDTAFAEYVQLHHLQYRNVKELAKSMNMTPQQFSRRFTGIFKQPPYEWMLQERARLIYSEICVSDKPFKEIANDFGFSLQENFIRFCRTSFGAIPSVIRKKERDKRADNCLYKK